MKKAVMLVVASGVVAALVGYVAQDEFVLRRELKAGAKETYKVTTKVSQTMTPADPNQAAMLGGEMKFEMSMAMDMGIDFSKVADDTKSADLEMTFSEIVYDLGSMADMVPTESMPKTMKATGKIDERSRLTDFKMPDLPVAVAGNRGLMGPMMVELPEKAVKVGDSWETPLPTAEMLGAKDSKMTAKLIAIEEYKNIQALVVELTADLPIDADLSEMAQASGAPPMKILAKGRFRMTGKAHVDRTNGRTLKMNVTFDTVSHLTMPEVGIEFNTTGIGTSVIEMVLPTPARAGTN